jgi:hypothetical protein
MIKHWADDRALRSHQRQWQVAIAVLAGCIALVFWRYGMALDNWWCCDDPQILLHALKHQPLAYFLVPEAWQALVPYSFTPWLTLAYDLDYGLFGLQPRYYYLHNLLILALCAWLLYLFAQPWTGKAYAAGVSVMFLAGVPIALASQQLMVRHYLEGLFYYLLMLLLARQAVQRQAHLYGLAAALAYLVAASAKEIWLPLGLLVFLMPVGTLRQRLRYNTATLLVIPAYALWRAYMLGQLLGGYTPGNALQDTSRIGKFLTAITEVPALLWQHPSAAKIAIIALGLAALYKSTAACLKSAPWLIMLACALFIPLYPLVITPGLGPGSERYYIALWAALALLTGVLSHRLAHGSHRLWQLLGLTLFLIPLHGAWQASADMLERQKAEHALYRAQGQALAELGPETAIFDETGLPSWYNAGIIALAPTWAMTNSRRC